ncbi:MAG: hypothetical protein ACREDO_05225 [Methyloceanibacter sp.]
MTDTEQQYQDTSPPDDTPAPEPEVIAELAKPDDITEYAEDRREQDLADEAGEPVKRASRYERLKRARDAYKAEAEELRRRLGEEPEPPQQTPSENPYEEEIEHGRREAESAHMLAERDQTVAELATFRTRAESVAPQYPDFIETVQTAKELGLNVPPAIERMIIRSPYGPQMAYALAKDALHPEGQGIIAQLERLADDPVAQAREFGRMEQTFEAHLGGRQPRQQRRTTSAPPPMRPITGGSSAPKDLVALASKDDVSDYARARKGND